MPTAPPDHTPQQPTAPAALALQYATRNYSWGSRTLIPELMGQPASDKPVAELWYGAHPAAPASTEAGTGLDAVIATDPVGYLGAQVAEDFDGTLPFLMKLLAADEPLSLQAHPTMAQAQAGFAAENERGIALSDNQRNYKDPSHKPEIIIALTPFYAMAGFRPLARTRELFEVLDCPALDHYTAMLPHAEQPDAQQEAESLRALFTTWITIPAPFRKNLITDIMAAAERLRAASQQSHAAELPTELPEWMDQVLATIIDLNDRYPGDIGVLGALLLNHIVLQPGEALYLDAGQLHAYVSGLGVEVMANSDNVLRGGLTPKHVDVPELVKVLDFHALENPRVATAATSTGPGVAYPVPVPEFSVERYDLAAGDGIDLHFDGPAIVLSTAGTARVAAPDTAVDLAPAGAVFIPAGVPWHLGAAGGSAQVFIAHV